MMFDFDDAIWTVDAEGTELGKIVDANPYRGSGSHRKLLSRYGFYADLSPDGSRIVYSTCQYRIASIVESSKFGYEIATMDMDGANQWRWTNNEHIDHFPVWSPDGTRIAFLEVDLWLDSPRIYMITPYESRPGPGPWRLPFRLPEFIVTLEDMDVALYPPVWSPDGQRLAFIVNEGESGPYREVIYTVRTDGSELNRIGETAVQPAWRPGGEELVFAKAGREKTAIYAARHDGTGLREIWDLGPGPFGIALPLYQVSWSPGGSELLVVFHGGRSLCVLTAAVRCAWPFRGGKCEGSGHRTGRQSRSSTRRTSNGVNRASS